MSKTNKLSKENKILLLTAIFLASLYIISFKSSAFSDKREKLKTSLVNPKYKDNISKIELYDSMNSLEINKRDNFWTVQYSNDNNSDNYSLPADEDRVNKLLENLTTIRNLYKISDNISENSSFGLTDGREFHIRYYYDSDFHELIFGNQDFSLSSRYLMTEKSSRVYECDSSLDKYLTTSIQSWAEPYIISRLVFSGLKAADIQTVSVTSSANESPAKYLKLNDVEKINKLLELRHGGPAENSPDNKEILNIQLDLGNRNSITLDFYNSGSSDEELYVVKNQYINASGYKVYTSFSKISGWTYRRIREIML